MNLKNKRKRNKKKIEKKKRKKDLPLGWVG
jgi:hypothetical protein